LEGNLINEKLEQLNNETEANQFASEAAANTQAELANSEAVNQNITSATVLRDSTLELVKCSKCASLVRVDRIEKHIKRVHDRIGTVSRNKSKLRLNSLSTTSVSGIRRCRNCSSLAMPGDNLFSFTEFIVCLGLTQK